MIAQRKSLTEGNAVQSEKLPMKPKLPHVKKPKVKKRRRMIIRNLSFKVEEEELKQIFSKFGTILDVKIPFKQDGRKRGFAFVEFEDAKSLINAMKSMNYKEIHGRKVAIDYAVDKTSYETKLQQLKQEGKEVPLTKKNIEPKSEIKNEIISVEESDTDSDDEKNENASIKDKYENVTIKEESESEDEDDKRLNDFLKEFDSGADELTKIHSQNKDEDVSSSEESSSDESEGESENEEDVEQKKKIKSGTKDSLKETDSKPKVWQSQDISEGKTVFIRNVSFTTDEDSLREVVEEYGKCEYCVLCIDKLTDRPKGTAFVKFKEKGSADRLIETSFGEPGVLVDGRKLVCSSAISREDVSHLGDDSKKPKDKRNLYLLRVGMIMANSKESEDVSSADMTKRAQLEVAKRQKLRNVNFFVSDKRLMVHNIPGNYTDNTLRKLFKKAAGPGVVITEARIMKEFKKVDAQGNPLSKGFGFVTFKDHENALKALNELNNNPKIFTLQKRPIVEFSVENIVALHSKERRKEKIQLRNKRRTEEKKERQLNQTAKDKKETSASLSKGKKRKNKKKEPTEKSKENPTEDENTFSEEKSPSKVKKDKKRKNKKTEPIVNKRSKENPTEDENTYSEEKIPSKVKKKKKNSKQSRKEKKLLNKKTSQDSMVNLINQYKDKLKNKIT